MERVKRFLERWPLLNLIIRYFYIPVAIKIKSYLQYFGRNRLPEIEYITNPPTEELWIESWNSKDSGHRPFLIERIAGFSPFSSVLEIGCGVGPNLYMLGKKFPDTIIREIDINPLAVKLGNELLAKEGISNASISIGRVEELSELDDKNFDIVFTDAVLLLIGRNQIYGVVKEIIRISRKGLVFLEWHDYDQRFKDTHGLGVFTLGRWARDYVSLIKGFVSEEQIHFSKLPEGLWPTPGWERFGAIIQVILK